MSGNGLPFDRLSIRGADGNSLLRMYDAAREVADKSLSRLERARADRALQRITKELQKRHIAL
jgi:hypothetical protein